MFNARKSVKNIRKVDLHPKILNGVQSQIYLLIVYY